MATAAYTLPADFNTADLIARIPPVRIVSVAPKRLRMRLQATRGYKEYSCDPAPRGGYTFCDIEPVTLRMNAYNDQEPAGQRVEYESPVVRAAHIASRWSAVGYTPGLVTEGSWGVAALAAGVLEPASELLASLVARTERLANDYITHANDLKQAGKANQIGDNHRCLAAWLLGDAASKLDWFGRQPIVLTIPCPKCSSNINSNARGCPVCHVDLPEFYLSRPYLDVAAENPFIAKEIEKIKAMQAKPAPAPEPTPQPAAQAAPIKPPLSTGIPPPQKA